MRQRPALSVTLLALTVTACGVAPPPVAERSDVIDRTDERLLEATTTTVTIPPLSLPERPPIVTPLDTEPTRPDVAPSDPSPTSGAELEPLARLATSMLTDTEMPDGWEVGRAEPYEPASDGEALDGCPESSIVVDLTQRFDFIVPLLETAEDRWGGGSQFVGRLPGDVDPAAFVEAFVALDGCVGNDTGDVITLTAVPLDIIEADHALALAIETRTSEFDVDDFSGEDVILTFAIVDRVFTAFALPLDAPYIEFLQRAVTKVVDTGPY